MSNGILIREDQAEPVYSLPAKHNMVVMGNKGLIVVIDFDTGDVELGKDYTLTEAAKAFWQAVRIAAKENP